MTSHGCGAALRLPPTKKTVGDLFCGAGGASLGFKKAAKKLRLSYELKAINHWEAAVKVHAANFPDAQHVNSSIEAIDPRELFPKRRLDFLIAAPECTDHSVAKGGRPVKDQKRVSAWYILRWIELLYVKRLLIENVPEFVRWGPCNSKGKKIKKLAGTFFNTFINGLRAAGYEVEWKILCAADYGDATTRRRLFIMARRDHKPIEWPEPSHAEFPAGKLKPWVPMLKKIDWSKPGISIFRRHEYGLPPLKKTTLDRIIEGIRRYGPEELHPFLPFLVKFFSSNKVKSLRQPLGTVMAKGQHYALAEPILLQHRTFNNANVDSIRKPMRTLVADARDIALAQPIVVEPMILGHRMHKNPVVDSTKRPFRTITSKTHDAAIAQPIVLTPGGPSAKSRTARKPLGTVTCKDRFAIATPVVVQTDQGGSNGKCVRPVTEPAYTITSSGQLAVAYPWILPHLGRTKQNKPQSIRRPLGTVTGAHGAGRLVQSVIVGTGGNKGAARARPTSKPLRTVTTSNRSGVASTFLLEANHGNKKGERHPNGRRVRSVQDPLGTLTTSRGMALVSAFIDKYYGTGVAQSRHKPLGTITAKMRFGLVEVCVGRKPIFYFDILFRMLEPEELAAAMGFPKGYFADVTLSKEEIVRMIGNAWPVNLGAALCEAILRR